MKLSRRHRTYWRLTLGLTGSLLSVWFMVVLLTAYFAEALSKFEVLGFPLSFYIFAQGALLLFLVLIGLYVLVMNRLDRRFGVAESRRR